MRYNKPRKYPYKNLKNQTYFFLSLYILTKWWVENCGVVRLTPTSQGSSIKRACDTTKKIKGFLNMWFRVDWCCKVAHGRLVVVPLESFRKQHTHFLLLSFRYFLICTWCLFAHIFYNFFHPSVFYLPFRVYILPPDFITVWDVVLLFLYKFIDCKRSMPFYISNSLFDKHFEF